MKSEKASYAIFGAALLLTWLSVPAAYGQATHWSYTASQDVYIADNPANGVTGGGIKLRNVQHTLNSVTSTIMDRINLPYIWVYYADGFSIRDDFPYEIPCSSPCWGKVDHALEKHTFTGGEYQHSIYFVGCQNWPAQGCYKYEIQYWFYNDQPGSGTKPEMQMWLRAWGPGYQVEHGVPTEYEVYWRMDTDVKGSSSDKIERFTTSWVEVTTETAHTSIGSTDGGIEWRTYDTGTGNGVSKRVEVWPVTGDFDKIWYILFKGTKSDPMEYDGHPDGYDNNAENIVSKDDLFWYRTDRPGSDCQPTAPCSQVFVVTLSGL